MLGTEARKRCLWLADLSVDDGRMRSLLRPISAAVVVTFGLAVACSTSDPSPTGAPIPKGEIACDIRITDNSVTQTWTIEDRGAVAKATVENTGSAATYNIEVKLDGVVAFQSDVTMSKLGGVSNTSRYLTPFATKETVVDVQAQGGSWTVKVDGRRLAIDTEAAKKAPPATIAFDDGTSVGPIVPKAIETRINDAVNKLMGAEKDARESCVNGTAPDLSQKGEPGRPSSPHKSAECNSCRNFCGTKFIACTAGTIFGCWAGCFGLAAVPIVGAALVVTCNVLCNLVLQPRCATDYSDCLENCRNQFCCPVSCGPSATQCCAAGESCLNSATGLCCRVGLTPCRGKTCFDNAAENCMPDGSACPKEKTCGSNCCKSPGGGFGTEENCVSPVHHLCCRVGLIACVAPNVVGPGAAVCCPPGGCLPDGTCINPNP